jgi:5-carboxymethyl-2-hydroxymuconate isomerase
MPHLIIDYTGNLDAQCDMPALCAALARTLVEFRDGDGQPVFPLHGTRVLAYPAPHHAVADGAPERAFVYLNLRITAGRSAALVTAAGAALLAQVRAQVAPLLERGLLRVTLHIDVGQPVYEGKLA